ncbi:PBP1A family penicillin-binding protein [Candidatus Shapirobacteria bacterium]|nr:PBP1A family penicillin-binding protein [Candidatus Shapirobacteria bacterium]
MRKKNLINRLKSLDFGSRRFWYRAVLAVLVLGLVGYMAVLVTFVWYSKDLPTPNKVVRRDGFSSRIYDRNGELVYDVYKDAKRVPVVWEDVPDTLKNATVAVEDKDFYKHQGFDPLTPFRIIKNIFTLGKFTGGSTLTQQLVKNVLLTSDRTVTRKIKEFMLSVQIEAKYKKSEILLMYLNESPYGGADWGVGIAAEQYFDKSVKDLTLPESVILAGLPQRPNVYSPFSKTPTAYIDRASHVIDRMVEDGYISEDMGKETLEAVKNFKFAENKSQLAAPHFIFWLKDELSRKYGDEVVEGGGLKITSTLDLKLQEKVQTIVSEEIDKAEKLGISNGAAVVIDPTNGQVLAMVGSRGYNSDKTDGKFNVVTQALRQPGSAIKPVTYLTAIRKGYSAASMVMDTPVTFPGTAGQKDYNPQNYNGKYNGPLSLAQALGNSINTVAVKMLANVGLSNMLRQAYDMGMTTLEPSTENLRKYGLAVTLGGAEVKMIDLASSYGAFANGGKRVDPVGILKVEDRSGRVLEEFKPSAGKQVMSPQEAFIISNILADNNNRIITFGAVNGLQISGYQVAAKTGTTNDKKDNWTIGWTPNLLTTVWVGNNDNTPMLKVASGVSGASPIWKRIMLASLPGRPKQDFSIPSSIVHMDVDKVSGYASHDGFPSVGAYFVDGTQPKNNDPIHLKLKVCKDKGGLAPPEDISNGNFNEKEFFKFREDDPISKDGKNRWQEGIDGWVSQQPDKDKYFPPESYCRNDGTLSVKFDEPSDHASTSNNLNVKLSTDSLKKITEMKLWVNGVEKKVWSERPFEINLQLEDGLYTLKARATDKDGASNEREIKIGVNKPWDWTPSPTPTTVPTLGPTIAPTPTTSVIVPTLVPTVLPSPTSI